MVKGGRRNPVSGFFKFFTTLLMYVSESLLGKTPSQGDKETAINAKLKRFTEPMMLGRPTHAVEELQDSFYTFRLHQGTV